MAKWHFPYTASVCCVVENVLSARVICGFVDLPWLNLPFLYHHVPPSARPHLPSLWIILCFAIAVLYLSFTSQSSNPSRIWTFKQFKAYIFPLNWNAAGRNMLGLFMCIYAYIMYIDRDQPMFFEAFILKFIEIHLEWHHKHGACFWTTAWLCVMFY